MDPGQSIGMVAWITEKSPGTAIPSSFTSTVAHVCFVHVTMQMCCVGGPAGMVAQHPRFEWLGALEHQLTVSVPKGVRWGPPLSRKQRRTEVDHGHGFILLSQPLGSFPLTHILVPEQQPHRPGEPTNHTHRHHLPWDSVSGSPAPTPLFQFSLHSAPMNHIKTFY